MAGEGASHACLARPQAFHAPVRPAAAPVPAAVGAGAEGCPESPQAGEEAKGTGGPAPQQPRESRAAEAGRAGPAKLSSETEPRARLSLGWLGTTLLVAWPARHCGELETEGVLVVISREP